MSLKTVGTLNWNVCKKCRHGVRGQCDPFFHPEFHYNIKHNTVECADYLSISTDESEE
jgi:hypothetical protein